jgi:hypothetical protein
MAVAARKQSAPSSATSRIEAAQAALEESNRKLAELNEQRNAALLRDDNAAAVQFGIEIANLKLSARAEEDRIALLREQATREEQERRAQERAVLIEKIEAKIALRDKELEEVAAAIKQLAAASERAINLSREIVNEWTWQPHDLPPALLTPSSIMTAISHESYRLSYHARRYGGQDTDPLAGVMLPGSRAPTLQLLEDPSRVPSMSETVCNASAFARTFLRTGKGSAVVEGVQHQAVTNGVPGQRTDAEQQLSDLLVQMAKLAEDSSPAGEQRYLELVSQVAAVQAEVAAQQQVERQNGR